MSWIKIRTNLATDPSVAAIGMRTKMHPRQVVGCLVAVWCWADPLTENGRIEHGTESLVDEVAGKRGFASAMAAVQWLIVESDAVVFPKWDRHHSQSAKARAGETERKRISRESGQPVRKMSGQSSGQSAEVFTDQRRGEEIREEIQNTPLPPKGGELELLAPPQAGPKRPKIYDEEFEPIYQAYPSFRRGGRLEAFRAIRKALTYIAANQSRFSIEKPPAAHLLAATKAYAESSEVRQRIASGEGNYLPMLTTWLNGGRFEAPMGQAPAGSPVPKLQYV